MRSARVLTGLLLAAGTFLAAGPLRAADLVPIAYWDDDGNWYPVEVLERGDDQVRVRYVQDGTEERVARDHYAELELSQGIPVWAKKTPRAERFFRGKVQRWEDDQLYILFLDGDAAWVAMRDLSFPELRYERWFTPGHHLFGEWTDGYYYPGYIQEIRDDKYRFRFDDGDERWLDKDQLSTYSIQYDDPIEVNWLGRGLYYRCVVTKRKGEQITVEYEDGDVETTTIDFARLQLR